MHAIIRTTVILSLSCPAAFATDDEWAPLNREIELLSSTLSLDGGPGLSGQIGVRYDNNSDFNIGGFSASDARLALEGSHGDYGYRVEVDFAGETHAGLVDTDMDGVPDGLGLITDRLMDAYTTFGIGASVTARMGRFRASVCDDSDMDEGDMDHLRHSMVGAQFTRHTDGLAFSGAMDLISWDISIMNGFDGALDELLTAVRVRLEPMDGASLSAAVVDDASLQDVGATVITAGYQAGAFGVGLEYADVADAGASTSFHASNIGTLDFSVLALGGTNPMCISATFDVNEDWMLAVRHTDADYPAAVTTESLEVTANHGNWQIGLMDGQLAGFDFDYWAIGLNVGF